MGMMCTKELKLIILGWVNFLGWVKKLWKIYQDELKDFSCWGEQTTTKFNVNHSIFVNKLYLKYNHIYLQTENQIYNFHYLNCWNIMISIAIDYVRFGRIRFYCWSKIEFIFPTETCWSRCVPCCHVWE